MRKWKKKGNSPFKNGGKSHDDGECWEWGGGGRNLYQALYVGSVGATTGGKRTA